MRGNDTSPLKRVEKKHLLATRWFHWVNFPVIMIMIWSGLLIYWANPAFRIGWGGFTLVHLFPDWFFHPVIHGAHLAAAGTDEHPLYEMSSRLADGMAWHFFFMWLFTINGLLYVLYTALSGEWRYLVPGRGTLKAAIQVVLHDLRIRKEPLPLRKFNGAQQIAYTSIILMGAGSVLTGLAVYKPIQFGWAAWMLGGYRNARFFHFWLMMGYCGFFVIHIAQVMRAGWNNFRSMVTGYEIVPVEGVPVGATPTIAEPEKRRAQ